MNSQLLIGITICFINTIFGAFWFFGASSGKIIRFNSIMESIVENKKLLDKTYSIENVKETWQAFGFFFMLANGIGFLIVLKELII